MDPKWFCRTGVVVLISVILQPSCVIAQDCVANAEEFEQFKKENPKAGNVVWLDWSFGEALYAKGCIAVERKEWQVALDALTNAIEYCPYSPRPHQERGVVQNLSNQRIEALRSYKRALDLSRQIESAKPFEGAALRGIGHTLIRLGELQAARIALQQSLKFEPDHPVARNELEYIRELEKQKR